MSKSALSPFDTPTASQRGASAMSLHTEDVADEAPVLA